MEDERRGGRSRERIVIRAKRKAGGGRIQASGCLFFGFLILMLSEVEAQFLIGLLLSASVVAQEGQRRGPVSRGPVGR